MNAYYLHREVLNASLDEAQDILRRNPSRVNSRDESYVTLLHRTCKDSDVELTQLLLSYGANVNAQEYQYLFTPLHCAVQLESDLREDDAIKVVKLLLEQGADFYLRDIFSCTALHKASWLGYSKIVEILLEHGAEINPVDWEGYTPLDCAILNRDLYLAQILIDAGAKARNIFNAVLEEDINEIESLVTFLIVHGAKIDADKRFSIKALYFVWLDKKPYSIETFEEALLGQGVDLEGLKREGPGNTPLHVAAKEKDKNRVEALLKAGADVNKKNVIYETPLHSLLDNDPWDDDRIYETAKILIKAGADLQERDGFNFTPFQLAAYEGHTKVLNYMLSKIARVKESTINARYFDKDYYPYEYLYPLAIAVSIGHEKAVDNLIKMQHHIKDTNNVMYKSPLCYAVQKHYGITKMLLEAGCRFDERYICSQPIIDCSYFCESDVKIIYLLWEFNENSIVQYTLIHCILSNYNLNPTMKLLLFYFVIGLRTKKLKAEFSSMEQFVRLKQEFSTLLDVCNDKLDELKTVYMNNDVSVYEILMKPIDSLVKFIENKDDFDACAKLISTFENKQSLESHEKILKFRIKLAVEKRRILDCAKNRLIKTIGSFLEPNYKSLPDEIVWKIFKDLNDRELKKLAYGK